jgi:probable F420-dependent oxidoreductase
VQIGFNVPTSGILATPDTMARIAIEGEALGYGYLTLSDHVVIPKDIHARYPYSETGEFPGKAATEWQEQLTAAMFLAAKTSRLRVHTSVMVVPHRPAVLAAKILSTIDVFSGGRLSVGCGAGWMKEEFAALGAPPFEARGAVTDEYLQAFRELWTKDEPRFEGRYVRFADIVFAPKPVQLPHPPLWVGGESGPAMRRAARFGDGWYPIGGNPQHPLDTLPRYREAIERVRHLAADAGRDPASIRFGYRCQRHGGAAEPRLFAGTPAEIAADLRAFRDLGVEMVDFSFAAATAEATIDNMRRFRDEVIASL